jgi:hypothetical protein
MARLVEGTPACEIAPGECRACFIAGERERAALECSAVLLDALRAIPIDPDAERIAPPRRARNDDCTCRLAPALRSAQTDALRHRRIMAWGVSAETLLSVMAGMLGVGIGSC